MSTVYSAVRQPFKVILMGMAHANSFVPLSFFGEKRKQEGGDFSIVNVKLKHILRVLITCPTPCTMDLKSFCNRICLYLVYFEWYLFYYFNNYIKLGKYFTLVNLLEL